MRDNDEITLHKTVHSVHWSPLSGKPAPTLIFVVAIVFMLIGLSALPGSFYLYLKEHNFSKIAVSTPGTVIDLVQKERRGNNNRRSIVYAPLVQFIDQNGNTQKYLSPHGSNPPDYRRGDKLTVLYEPDNPEFAVIDDWQRYLLVIVLGILGVSFTLSSLFILWLAKKGKNQKNKRLS